MAVDSHVCSPPAAETVSLREKLNRSQETRKVRRTITPGTYSADDLKAAFQLQSADDLHTETAKKTGFDIADHLQPLVQLKVIYVDSSMVLKFHEHQKVSEMVEIINRKFVVKKEPIKDLFLVSSGIWLNKTRTVKSYFFEDKVPSYSSPSLESLFHRIFAVLTYGFPKQ